MNFLKIFLKIAEGILQAISENSTKFLYCTCRALRMKKIDKEVILKLCAKGVDSW